MTRTTESRKVYLLCIETDRGCLYYDTKIDMTWLDSLSLTPLEMRMALGKTPHQENLPSVSLISKIVYDEYIAANC